MNISEPAARIPVGVVVERRAAMSRWVDVIWCPVAVLSGCPDAPIWTPLGNGGEATMFYAGPAEIELYRSETGNYRDNLASGAPLVWVCLHETGGEPPYRVAAVTADPAEGEGLSEPGTALVESVTMAETIREAVAAFIAEHHVEKAFDKRKRDRANPEAMARRTSRDGNRDE